MKGNRDNRYYVVWLYKGLRRFCRLILWKGREAPNEEKAKRRKGERWEGGQEGEGRREMKSREGVGKRRRRRREGRETCWNWDALSRGWERSLPDGVQSEKSEGLYKNLRGNSRRYYLREPSGFTRSKPWVCSCCVAEIPRASPRNRLRGKWEAEGRPDAHNVKLLRSLSGSLRRERKRERERESPIPDVSPVSAVFWQCSRRWRAYIREEVGYVFLALWSLSREALY